MTLIALLLFWDTAMRTLCMEYNPAARYYLVCEFGSVQCVAMCEESP